ncbi:hypothetical protein ACLMJK_009058 [Lecanora helva]
MALPESLPPALLRDIERLPNEVVELILLGLYPPNFFNPKVQSIEKLARTYRETIRARFSSGEEDGKDEERDHEQLQENGEDSDENATSLGESSVDSETRRLNRLHASPSRAKAWKVVLEADQILLNLHHAHPQLRPNKDRVLIEHSKREGRLAQERRKAEVMEKGLPEVFKTHDEEVKDAEGIYRDSKRVWDECWKLFGRRARGRRITVHGIGIYGHEGLDAIEDSEQYYKNNPGSH